MNVALIIDSLRSGGSEGVVKRLARGLAERGLGIRVYCLKQSQTDVSELRAAGVLIREARAKPRDMSLWLRLLDWLRRDQIDLIHAHSCSGLVASFPAAKLLSLPIVHVRHGWPPGPRARHTLLADWLGPCVDQVVINAESGRAKLRSAFVRRHTVHIPNGLDVRAGDHTTAIATLEALCQRSLPRPLVMTIANLRREKGIRELLRGFAILRQKHPTATLVVVGRRLDETYARQVDADVANLNLESSVHFVGPVPDAQRLLPAVDVYCLSSTHEAMPNVVLEAMAHQMPIVATTVGDVGRLDACDRHRSWLLKDGETALLAPSGDAEALAAALDQACTDQEAAKQRAKRAHTRYQREYRTATMVERYTALYKRLLSRRPRRAKPNRPPTIAHLGPRPNERGGMVTSIRLLMQADASKTTRQIRLSNAPSQSSTPGWAILNHAAALWRLTTKLITQPVDVLHIHTCSGFTFYRNSIDAAIARLLGVNVIWHIRGGKFAAFCEATTGWRRRLLSFALSEAERVITLAPVFARKLAAFAPEARITTIPNAFDPDVETTLREPNSDSACRFLYLATLRKGKGIHELLTASETLAQRRTNFELVLLGDIDPEEQRAIERRLAGEALRSNVRWLGPANLEMKRKWLAWADVFVHPSHSEGLPNAVLEAAASGLPIIATDVGATRDVLQPDPAAEPLCPLILPEDAATLVDAMQKLIDDPESRERMGTAIVQHVREHYHIERIAAQVNAVYTALLGRELNSRPHHPASHCTRPPQSPPQPSVDAARHHSDQSQTLLVSESS